MRICVTQDGHMKAPRIQLDPTYPLCWESIETLRFGFDEARVRLHSPTPAEQRFIGKLRAGLSARELPAVAKKCGLTPHAQQRLLHRLEAVLVQLSPARASAQKKPTNRKAALPQIEVLGNGQFAHTLGTHLARTGASVTVSATPHLGAPRLEAASEDASAFTPDFAVVVERFLGAGDIPQRLYSRGVPHFPINLTDTSLYAGPLVHAMGSPCLACVEQHRFETDPQLAVLAAQLSKQIPAAETVHSAEFAANLAIAAIREWQSGVKSPGAARVRFPVHAGVPVFAPSAAAVVPHRDCGCGLFSDGR